MSSASSSASPSPHSSLSPSPSLGGSSSANSSNTSLPSKNSKIHGSRVKPVNIFSNDGSFLERFQRIKREEEEKKKAEEAAQRKREFEDRFKKRGKRLASDPSMTNGSDDVPSKKAKIQGDKIVSEYEKELNSYNASLKDNGIGVRPLVK